jgi:hypothetical protein
MRHSREVDSIKSLLERLLSRHATNESPAADDHHAGRTGLLGREAKFARSSVHRLLRDRSDRAGDPDGARVAVIFLPRTLDTRILQGPKHNAQGAPNRASELRSASTPRHRVIKKLRCRRS